MENAAKALLIAGGVLISILVIGAFIFLFRDISKTQVDLEEVKALQQVDEFNKQFTSYEKTLYGHELLSLINMITDYNEKATSLGYNQISIRVENLTLGTVVNQQNYDRTPTQNTIGFMGELIEIKFEMEDRSDFYGMTTSDKENLIKLWAYRNDITSSDNTKKQKARQLHDLLKRYCVGNGFSADDAGIRSFISRIERDKGSTIERYEDYIDFKRRKFEFRTTGFENRTGRINRMEFRQR